MWQKIINQIKAALSGSSLLHGAALAALVALTKLVYPVIDAWNNGAQAPAINFTTSWHMVAGAFVLYIIKNAIFGSSNSTKI